MVFLTELKIQPTLNPILIPQHIRNATGGTQIIGAGRAATGAVSPPSAASSSVSSSNNSASNLLVNSGTAGHAPSAAGSTGMTSTQELKSQAVGESLKGEPTSSNA